jgi:hypothetical protein
MLQLLEEGPLGFDLRHIGASARGANGLEGRIDVDDEADRDDHVRENERKPDEVVRGAYVCPTKRMAVMYGEFSSVESDTLERKVTFSPTPSCVLPFEETLRPS